MSFIQRDFAWFLLVAFGLWWFARGKYALRMAVMLATSLFFYARGHWWFLAIIMAYSAADWGTALWLERTQRRRLALATGVGFNLAILCFWKYTPLLVRTFGGDVSLSVFAPDHWIVPMGISFYAFSGIAYMTDVYRGVVQAERSFWCYTLFTAFFPHLVAGPILRAKEFLSHLGPGELPERPESPLEGAFLIGHGFFKKLVIADSIAAAIDPFFANVAHPSTVGVWSLPYVYLYALQIYFDFSGYTDIARGLGLWFGFRWPENFNRPYLAASIQDFWRRWHITLSRFLRDYLYISLGGNRCGALRASVNLMITMTLGGLWHGASWSFLIWGGLHGLFLIVHRLWASTRIQRALAGMTGLGKALWSAAGIALTFNAVCLAWCFFRLTRLGESLTCVRKLASFEPGKMFVGGAADVSLWLLLSIYAVAVIAISIFTKGKSLEHALEGMASKPFAKGLVLGSALGLFVVSLLLAITGEKAPFIYFQF